MHLGDNKSICMKERLKHSLLMKSFARTNSKGIVVRNWPSVTSNPVKKQLNTLRRRNESAFDKLCRRFSLAKQELFTTGIINGPKYGCGEIKDRSQGFDFT